MCDSVSVFGDTDNIFVVKRSISHLYCEVSSGTCGI